MGHVVDKLGRADGEVYYRYQREKDQHCGDGDPYGCAARQRVAREYASALGSRLHVGLVACRRACRACRTVTEITVIDIISGHVVLCVADRAGGIARFCVESCRAARSIAICIGCGDIEGRTDSARILGGLRCNGAAVEREQECIDGGSKLRTSSVLYYGVAARAEEIIIMLRVDTRPGASLVYPVAAHDAVRAGLSVRRDENNGVAAFVQSALEEHRRVYDREPLAARAAFAEPCLGCRADIAMGYSVQQATLILRTGCENYRTELAAAQRAVRVYNSVAESLRYLANAGRIRSGNAGIFLICVEYRYAALAEYAADLAFSRAAASGYADYLHVCPPIFSIFSYYSAFLPVIQDG